MSHFAKIVDGIVTQVIVAEQDFVDTLDGTWLQTSYNTRGGKHYDQDGNEDDGVALRKNYAGIDFTYDADRDAFIPPKPFDSWVLDEDTCWWESPIAMPELSDADQEAGKYYIWDEDTYQADNTTGWILIDPAGA